MMRKRLVYGIHLLHRLYRLNTRSQSEQVHHTLGGFGGDSDLKAKQALSTLQRYTEIYFD
jgi:hypothetical protein